MAVRTWFAPLVLATVSMLGLISALLGDGAYDMTAWVGLAAPVASVAWALAWRRR